MDERVKTRVVKGAAAAARSVGRPTPAGRPRGPRAHPSSPRAAKPPALDFAGLDQNVGYVVRRAQVWIFQDVKRTLREFDFTPAQFSVLKLIGANPGSAQARVADALVIERARLVQMLDRLEARGLITRTRSPTDRRSHALNLTPQGNQVLGQLVLLIDEHERRVVARIGSKGKTELLSILAPLLS